MPPFNFGQVTGQAFQRSFENAQDRQQQAQRQRAIQRLRKRRLEQNARQARKKREQQQKQFETQMDMKRRQQAAESMNQMMQNAREQRRFEQTTTPISEVEGVEGNGRVQNSLLVQAQMQGRGSGQGQPSVDDMRKRMEMRAGMGLQRARSALPPGSLSVPEEGLPDPENLEQRRDQVFTAAQQAIQTGQMIPMMSPERQEVMRKRVGSVLRQVDKELRAITQVAEKGFSQGVEQVEGNLQQENQPSFSMGRLTGGEDRGGRDDPVTNAINSFAEQVGLRQPDLTEEERQEMSGRSRRLQRVRDQTRRQLQPIMRQMQGVNPGDQASLTDRTRNFIFEQVFLDEQGRFDPEAIEGMDMQQVLGFARTAKD